MGTPSNVASAFFNKQIGIQTIPANNPKKKPEVLLSFTDCCFWNVVGFSVIPMQFAMVAQFAMQEILSWNLSGLAYLASLSLPNVDFWPFWHSLPQRPTTFRKIRLFACFSLFGSFGTIFGMLSVFF